MEAFKFQVVAPSPKAHYPEVMAGLLDYNVDIDWEADLNFLDVNADYQQLMHTALNAKPVDFQAFRYAKINVPTLLVEVTDLVPAHDADPSPGDTTFRCLLLHSASLTFVCVDYRRVASKL